MLQGEYCGRAMTTKHFLCLITEMKTDSNPQMNLEKSDI